MLCIFSVRSTRAWCAGVVPIDRLTEMHAPVATLARRISRHQLHAVLHLTTARPKSHEDPDRPPTAPELLRAYAVARGWLNGSGLPDETRTGRQLLKDYTAGRLAYCEWPPGARRRCPYDDGLGTFTSRPELLHFASGAHHGQPCVRWSWRRSLSGGGCAALFSWYGALQEGAAARRASRALRVFCRRGRVEDRGTGNGRGCAGAPRWAGSAVGAICARRGGHASDGHGTREQRKNGTFAPAALRVDSTFTRCVPRYLKA